MDIKIERITFPYDTIPAVAAINDKNGTCTIYENDLCSSTEREKAVLLLIDEIRPNTTLS